MILTWLLIESHVSTCRLILPFAGLNPYVDVPVWHTQQKQNRMRYLWLRLRVCSMQPQTHVSTSHCVSGCMHKLCVCVCVCVDVSVCGCRCVRVCVCVCVCVPVNTNLGDQKGAVGRYLEGMKSIVIVHLCEHTHQLPVCERVRVCVTHGPVPV